MAITQTINAITTTPDIADPTNFEADANQLLNVELPNLQTQLNTWAGQANALVAGLNAIAAGSAMAISYTFSTTTTDSDPGAGTLRLNNATQNTATVVRADLLDAAGTDWSSALGTIGDSTSTVKGYLQISKLNDASKMLLFTVSALASPSGYKNITVSCIAFTTASPFTNGDTLIMEFTRTGDKGDTGTGFTGTATGTIDLLAGANIASAATVNLDAATGNRVHITGTTTITAVTLAKGPRTVIFDGILTLTHHATNNNLPGATNITTAAGDRAIYESDGTKVYCVAYVRADGTGIIAASPPGMTCVGAYAPSGVSSLDITSVITTGYVYQIELIRMVPASGDDLYFRTSGNNGVSFDSAAASYAYSGLRTSTGISPGNQTNSSATQILINPSSGSVSATASNGGFSGTIKIFNPSNTSARKAVSFQGGNYDGSDYWYVSANGWRLSTAVVDACQIKFAANNIASGIVLVFAYRNAP